MARHKETAFKQKLVKAGKENRRVPIWVILKTRNRELLGPRKRSWRRSKLKLHTKHAKKEYRRLKTVLKVRKRG